jgi:surface antigen
MMVSVAVSPSDNMPYAGNRYAFGNCTYWAAQRRAQIGKPIPNTWGDAYLWAGRARADSYIVDHTPTPGAIMQTSGGSLGHVAFVESVDGDGTWHISEMNVIGLNQADYRKMSPQTASYYNFIH